MSKFDNILNSKTPVNVIIDRPATGKTFAVLKLMIDRYLADGSTSVYAVRTRQEFRYAKQIFRNIFDIYIIDKTNNEYNNICYKNTKFYLCKIEKDKIVKIDKNYFCRLLSINSAKIYDIAVNNNYYSQAEIDNLSTYDFRIGDRDAGKMYAMCKIIVGGTVNVSPDIGYKCDSNAGIVLYDISEPCFELKDEAKRFFGLLSYAIDTNFMSCTKIFITSNYKHSVKNYVDKFDIDISQVKAGNTIKNEYITIFVGGDVSR